MKYSKIKSFIYIFIILLLFVAFSYISQNNIYLFLDIASLYGLSLVLIYIIFVALAIVIAPVSAIPLLPLASNVFGWINAAIYSITGWFIGSLIAFLIARKYGKPIVGKLMNIKRLEEIEKIIPDKNVFISLIFLRMSIPVDILSYALGLFTNIKKRTFIITTLIGISPFAFLLSYLGTVPVTYQIISFIIGIIVLIIGWSIAIKKI